MEQSEKQIEELVIAYFSGVATPEEITMLAAWVKKNPENKRHYEQLQNLWQLSNPQFLVTDDDLEKAHAKVMGKLSLQPWYLTLYKYWQQVAAVLLLPLLVLSAYFYFRNDAGENYVAYQKITVPFGTYSQINLPDGSVAWLNAGSTLKFPTVFKNGERSVFLSGEAFFEVESDKENPFIVATDLLKVKATGTAFNVEAYKKEPVAVTMVRGKVHVQLNNEADKVGLKPGERLLYGDVNKSFEITETDPYKWYAWKDGNLIFRDDSLSYILKKIGQIYNVDITIRDPEIGMQPYRVTFEKESLPVILELMKLTAPIDYKVYEPRKSSDNRYNKTHIEFYSVKRKP